jgi:hypothetical protein
MRAALRHIHSHDIYDLSVWSPDDEDFGVLLQLMVGPDGSPGEESFSVTLCTPGWLRRQANADGIVDGRHHFVVTTYDHAMVERYFRRRVAACEGDSWAQVAAQVSRIGRWEFEDYSEMIPDPAERA